MLASMESKCTARTGIFSSNFCEIAIDDRTDSYGGPKENRARLPLEIMNAIAAEIGPGRTGLRLSPVTPVNDAKQDSDAQGLFNYLVEQLSALKLAFIHVIEGATGGARDIAPFDYAALRHRYKSNNEQGAWIVNNGYTRVMAMDAVATNAADMVAFGKLFISNPDLVNRLRLNAALTPPNSDTFYGGGAPGYTNYPPLDFAAERSANKDGLAVTELGVRRFA